MKNRKRLLVTLSKLVLSALIAMLFICGSNATNKAYAASIVGLDGPSGSEDEYTWTIASGRLKITPSADSTGILEVEFASSQEYPFNTIEIAAGFTEIKMLKWVGNGTVPITNVVLPEGLTKIGDEVFMQWVNLYFPSLPSTLEEIGVNAFCECKRIMGSINLKNVKVIKDKAFYMCKKLTSVEAQKVTSIGDEAFRDCTELARIDNARALTTVGKSAFMGCNNLSSFSVGGRFSDIKASAFDGCTKLGSIDTSEVETFGNRALAGTSISKVDLKKAKTIGDGVFCGCQGLEYAIFDSMTPRVTSIGAEAFADCSKLKWSTEGSDKTDLGLVIPGTVTSIGNECFRGCSLLSKVTISEGTVNIGEHIFSGCNSLTNVIIPKTATGINEDALFNFSPEGTAANVNISYDIAAKLNLDRISSNVIFAFPDDEVCPHVKAVGLYPRIKQAATCTEDGIGIYICKLCKQDLDENDASNQYRISSKGHVPFKDERYIKTSATCTSPAVYYHNCGNCDCKLDTTYTSGKPAPHTYSKKKIQPATIMAAGKEYQVCTKCKAEKVNRVISQAFINCDDSVVYTGKAATPVKIIYANGRPINRSNYKITYKNNKAVGKATATINFKGDYANINNKPVTLSFYIVPKDKVPAYLNGFKVTPGKKEIKVAWKAIKKNVTGYQVQYALDKKFTQSVKTITIKKSSTASTTIKKLKPNTSYYVRVRAFNKVGKVYAYSPKWTTLGKAYKVK
ncbi:MAG: fibronectin type III domain-containing protein [Lachnospiraceae bacterium]|nr:fibronectin type III domain-containing protein [Lachnospiraceae bacterium]